MNGKKRPDGHVFTLEEIRGMGLADFEANEAAIDAQRGQLGFDRAVETAKGYRT